MQGEIDIIARDEEEIVFIEVKTRRGERYGEARDAVDKKKQEHIRNTARYFLYKYRNENTKVRMDVIEIYIKGDNKIINHIKEAFE